MLSELWESTEGLHARFRGGSPVWIEAIHAFNEEVDEFRDANNPDDLAEEAVDVMVTMIGVLLAEGVTLDMLNAAVAKVAAKNDAKTHETHALNSAGKIQRIGRV